MKIRKLLSAASVAGIANTIAIHSSLAANADFQSFFFDACISPSGGLAARCAETNNGQGDLSGDSESSLNPSQALSTGDSAVLAAQQNSQEMRERLQGRREDTYGGSYVEMGPWSFLLNARYGGSERDRTVDVDAERGYELDEYGADIGVDYRINDRLLWGVLLQWGSSDLEFDPENPGRNFDPATDAGNIETDRLGILTFVSAAIGDNGYLDASLGYTDLDMETIRNSVFQESNRAIPQTNSITSASIGGQELMLSASAGYASQMGAWTITPFIAATYIDLSFDSYTETDISSSGLAMEGRADDQTLVFGQVGARATRAVAMDGWVLVPQLRFEYIGELDRDRSKTTLSYVNDANNNVLELRGDETSSDRWDFAVGAVGILQNGWVPYVEYQHTFGASNFDRYQINLGLRIEL